MKRVSILFLAVVLLGALIALGGCVTAGKTSPEAFRAAIKTNFDKYGDSLIAGDPDAWISLWDEEGVQLPPGAPMVVGKAAIRQAIGAGLSAVKFETFSIDIVGTYVDNEFGFAYGNYTYTAAPKAGGDKILVDGKYETIFKRQADGSWKIFRDCFNSNK
jgi:ketosteroid isomerase-like protein